MKTTDQLAKLELSKEFVNGVGAIRAKGKSEDNKTWTAYWFDPVKSYSLVKYQYHLGLPGQVRTEGFDVLELREISNGAWFPIRAERIRQAVPSRNYQKWICTAEAVTMNDSSRDEWIYQANFPSGWLISDQTDQNMITAVVTEDGSELPLPRGTPRPRIPMANAVRPDAAKPATSE